MPFDWTEYLKLAKFLRSGGVMPSEEALQRCAISRAYYAAFKLGYNYLRDVKHDRMLTGRGKFSLHRYVKDEFLQTPDERSKLIGTYLDRLRELRVKADYLDDYEDGYLSMVDSAQCCIENSKKVIESIEALSTASP